MSGFKHNVYFILVFTLHIFTENKWSIIIIIIVVVFIIIIIINT